MKVDDIMADNIRRKNKNGQGGIHRHTNGKWYGYATDPYTKKRCFTKYYNTEKEADKARIILIHELDVHMHVEPSKITLIQLIEEFVEDQLANGDIGENAYRTKQDTIKRIKKMSIANMSIQKITLRHLKDCLHSMVEKSQAVIDKDYQLIKKAFECAVTEDYISRNPFSSNLNLKKPKSKKESGKIEAFEKEEHQQLITALEENRIKPVYKYMILLAISTGMRSGEIRGLKRSDIDFENGIIHVCRTVTRDKRGKSKLGVKAKTQKSIRDVPITPDVEMILLASVEEYKPNTDDLLYCNDNFGLIAANTLNEELKKICKKNDIRTGKKITFHMLRHTFATRWLESKSGTEVLQRILGHESITTTIDTYTDISKELLKESAQQYYEYAKRNIL